MSSVFTKHIPGRRPYGTRGTSTRARDAHTCIAEPEVSGKHHTRDHLLRLSNCVVYPLKLRSALCRRSFESRDDECWRLQSRVVLRACHLPAGGRHPCTSAHSAPHGARRATRPVHGASIRSATRPVYGARPWRWRAGELWRTRWLMRPPMAVALRRGLEQPPEWQAATRTPS